MAGGEGLSMTGGQRLRMTGLEGVSTTRGEGLSKTKRERLDKPETDYLRKVSGSGGAIFALSWFCGTFIAWIPISLATDRISYVYYFYPTVGAVCMAVAITLHDLTAFAAKSASTGDRMVSEYAVPFFLLCSLAAFIFLVPAPYIWKVPLCAGLYFIARQYLSKEKTTVPEQDQSVPSQPGEDAAGAE
jgi:hypothetical protein